MAPSLLPTDQHLNAPSPDGYTSLNAFSQSEPSDSRTPNSAAYMDDLQMSSFPSEPEDGAGDLGALLREGGGGPQDADSFLNDIQSRDLDVGEKHEDAVDFEDIGDDDLAEDEDVALGGPVQTPAYTTAAQTDGFLRGIEESAIEDMDDLFGDDDDHGEGILGLGPSNHVKPSNRAADLDVSDEDLADEDTVPNDSQTEQLEPVKLSAHEQKMYEIQQQLLHEREAPEDMKENNIAMAKLLFPSFDPDVMPEWTKLLAPKPAASYGKKPAKPPKPIKPTKVGLELSADQRNQFSSSMAPAKQFWDFEYGRLIPTVEGEEGDTPINEDIASEIDPNEILPGGITMSDLDVICADWDTLSTLAEEQPVIEEVVLPDLEDDDLFDEDYLRESQPVKKRKLGLDPSEIVSIHRYDMPSFDDPEAMTSNIARHIVLDLNDPHLLVEEVQPEAVRQQVTDRKAPKTIKEKLLERFNYSNDHEYEMLKQSHQSKIRSSLGNLSVEHSFPAIRLQWPYYQVKLGTRDARSFHRNAMVFDRFLPFSLSKATRVKRKHMKGKATKEIYATSEDLGLGDNSTSMLLEYSLEYPMIMSQTGMGARIINYYRRKDKDDNTRPKLEVGETTLLLPEDRSPFHIFGHIEAGETISALYNSMYRAPVFEQRTGHSDFLLLRSSTGRGGKTYHVRNIDHSFVVGQEFPSVEVPGPHSRKVTTASKNRLKMISFRIIRKKKSQRLRVEDVTKHFPDSTDMQNRQKMKEFLKFSKEHKEWEMQPGDPIPDEEVLQGYVRPEDVCLLEAMQVGQQYLHDAGFQDEDDVEEEEDTKDKEQSLEKQLAPWNTSKTFLQAAAGKAMLKVVGDGDPSGRGEAFNMIKTSMKGGFKVQGESAADKMAAAKELGGHTYNVARQQREYEQAIRKVWDSQKAALSSTVDLDDSEFEDEDEEEDSGPVKDKPTPRSEMPTPAAWRDNRDDDTMSRISSVSQPGKVLRIRRKVRKGGSTETVEETIADPFVIKQYLKKKFLIDKHKRSLEDITGPSGNADVDARDKKRIEEELLRLRKNKERRYQREKAKGISSTTVDGSPGSPGAIGSPAEAGATGGKAGKPASTPRKCANCGQVGHIKTNKKYADSPYCDVCAPLFRRNVSFA
ncbi:MAG: hypothetical protein Q9160_001426 [Pyrenula sp. 1 TL-2023]